MSFRYRIHFSGLITFVPHVAGNKMMLLFVDGGVRHRDPSGEELYPHYPFICFSLGDLDPASPRRPDQTGRDRGLCYLNREEIVIGDQPSDGAHLDYHLTSPVGGQPPSIAADHHFEEPMPLRPSVTQATPPALAAAGLKAGSQAPPPEDLTWIMPLGKVVDPPMRLELNPACLARDYVAQPSKNLLAARTQLCAGRLYCADFRRTTVYGERLGVMCDFKNEWAVKPHWSQMLATVVTYEPKVADGQGLAISSTRFCTGSAGRVETLPNLVFRSPDELGRDVDVRIWNAPFNDVLDLLGDPQNHNWPKPEGDRSFRSYFRLFNEPPKYLPVMTRDKKRISGFQASMTALDKHVGCPMSITPEQSFPIETEEAAQ